MEALEIETPIREPKYNHLFSSILPGPPAVRNIIAMEASERFAYYGMRAVLVIYLSDQVHGLGWSDGLSIAVFSYWTGLPRFLEKF